MALIPQVVMTIKNVKSEGSVLTCEDKKLDDKSRYVGTSISSERPSGPQEASQWKIVKCGEVFRMQNMMTNEWMYANEPTHNDDGRRAYSQVLTYGTGGADPPQGDLSFQWHFVRFGRSFRIKNAKRGEWLCAIGEKLSEYCRPVLACEPGGNDPKDETSAGWLIQPVAAFLGASLQHDLGRSSITVRIESSGYFDGNAAECYFDGVALGIKCSRGLSITVIDPDWLLVGPSCTYDIWEDYGERNRLVADLEALPIGYIVLAALRDSGMEKLSLAHWRVLQSLGSFFTRGEWRQGYALIGTKGGKAVAEAQGQAVTITGTIFSSIQGLTQGDETETVENQCKRPRQGDETETVENQCKRPRP